MLATPPAALHAGSRAPFLPCLSPLLLKVKENMASTRCKHFSQWGITWLVAAVGCASVVAGSDVTVMIFFTRFVKIHDGGSF